MNRFNNSNHISGKFDQELEMIRTKVCEMGDLVEKQLSLVIEAFTTGNADLAMQVLQQDDVIDEYEASIDEECANVIALRQPTGHDLNLLISVIKVANELESIAAKIEGIADITIQLNSSLPADT
ncbi:MAG: PhoU domain-containing protein [Methylococcaceae bacterium]